MCVGEIWTFMWRHHYLMHVISIKSAFVCYIYKDLIWFIVTPKYEYDNMNGPSIYTYRSICLSYTVQCMSVKDTKKAYPLHFLKSTNSFFHDCTAVDDESWQLVENDHKPLTKMPWGKAFCADCRQTGYCATFCFLPVLDFINLSTYTKW